MELKKIAVDKIRPNPLQHRTIFDEEKLEKLGSSIKSHGLVNPLTVQDVGDGNYELITGERRLRAAKLAGVTELDCLVKSIPVDEIAVETLIENIHNADLFPIEEANAIQEVFKRKNLPIMIGNFHTEFETIRKIIRKNGPQGLTKEQKSYLKVADEIGQSPNQIYRKLKPLYTLSDEELVKVEGIKDTQVLYSISTIESDEARDIAIDKIISSEPKRDESVAFIKSIKKVDDRDLPKINVEEPMDDIRKTIEYEIENIPEETEVEAITPEHIKMLEEGMEWLQERHSLPQLPEVGRRRRIMEAALALAAESDAEDCVCPKCGAGKANLVWKCCDIGVEESLKIAIDEHVKAGRILKAALEELDKVPTAKEVQEQLKEGD